MPRVQQLLLFRLGKPRYKLVSNFQLQEFLDYAQVFRGYLSLFCSLLKGKCYFSAHKVCWLEDIEACSQSSCYSSRDAISFELLSQEFTLLVA